MALRNYRDQVYLAYPLPKLGGDKISGVVKLQVSDTFGELGKPIDLALRATKENAGDEMHLRISGLPSGAYLTVGTKISGPTWEINLADASSAKLVLPESTIKNVELSVAAIDANTGVLLVPVQFMTVKIERLADNEVFTPAMAFFRNYCRWSRIIYRSRKPLPRLNTIRKKIYNRLVGDADPAGQSCRPIKIDDISKNFAESVVI